MLFFVFACEKETEFNFAPKNETSLNENQSQNLAGRFTDNPILADYRNGRLVFENQESFDLTIETLKDLDETELREIFNQYYNLGFIPLYPYYQETETERISDFLEKRTSLLPHELSDREQEFHDPLISDDLFASFLNYKREIVVDGKIVKYTFSGAFIVNESDSLSLESYIEENNINDFIPDARTLETGLNQITSSINVYVSPKVAPPASDYCWHGSTGTDTQFFEQTIPCIVTNGGGSYDPPNPNANYTASLIDYIDNLMPCNYDDAAAIDGFTPFGTRKVCFENLTNVRRTKTLYSNEDYFFYTSIAVKVKHQRRHSFLGVVWWATKKAHEVALVINQATFRITPANITMPYPNFNVPTNNKDKMLFQIGNIVYNDSYYGPVGSFSYVPAEPIDTPFDEDVIVQFFNDNISLSQSMDITANDVKDMFWDLVYDQAVDLFEGLQGNTPTKFTMIMNMPNSTIVHYVDLSSRKTNTKKIKDVLDYDWGFLIGFSVPLDGANNPITDPSQLINASNYSIEIPNLTEFEDIYMDFVGVTRQNATWAGSRMVYKATN